MECTDRFDGSRERRDLIMIRFDVCLFVLVMPSVAYWLKGCVNGGSRGVGGVYRRRLSQIPSGWL